MIVFREVLEATLIIAIALGATRGVAGRGRWVGGTMVAGIAGALVVAIFASAISHTSRLLRVHEGTFGKWEHRTLNRLDDM